MINRHRVRRGIDISPGQDWPFNIEQTFLLALEPGPPDFLDWLFRQGQKAAIEWANATGIAQATSKAKAEAAAVQAATAAVAHISHAASSEINSQDDTVGTSYTRAPTAACSNKDNSIHTLQSTSSVQDEVVSGPSKHQHNQGSQAACTSMDQVRPESTSTRLECSTNTEIPNSKSQIGSGKDGSRSSSDCNSRAVLQIHGDRGEVENSSALTTTPAYSLCVQDDSHGPPDLGPHTAMTVLQDVKDPAKGFSAVRMFAALFA